MPLDVPSYDPLEDITLIFSTKESLDEIDSLISQTRAYKAQLQTRIDQNIASIKKVDGNSSLFKLEALDKVFKDYGDAQLAASKINSTITNLTKNISHLDCAKHNLSHSLTVFQNLKILVDSYTQCKQLAKTNSYLEMVSPYKIMCSLAETSFVSFRSVSEINQLLNSVKRLKLQILDNIKQTYTGLFAGQLPQTITLNNSNNNSSNNNLETTLREGACELLESTPSTKAQTIDWCTDKVLYEMREIFRPDDEAGSLENLSRRYLYFKKLLNNFNSNLAQYFPASWELPLKITARFCDLTRSDLDVLLRTEFQNKSPSIDLFMSSLQLTLDLEKYIDVRFANKYKGKRLSVCFEPYLSLWISHQDAAMEKKMLSYMSEPKLRENNAEPQVVVPSSADLFRTYRSLLSQTLELLGNSSQNGTILTSLASFFSRWLNSYGDRVLKPLLLPDNIEIENRDEVIRYTVLLINTCDYCSTTTSQLEEKLAQLTSNPQNISNAFTTTKDLYDDLVAKGNRLLLKRVIPLDLVFAWKEFDNFDWSRVMVEDYSRYMVTLKNCLASSNTSGNLPNPSQSSAHLEQKTSKRQSSLELILSLLSREVYKYNFLDKVIDLTTSEYIDCITRLLQPIPPFATLNNSRILDIKHVIRIGEQLSLDLQLLKDVFHGCLESMASNSRVSQSTSYRRLEKHIDANITMLSNFVKLLVAPLDSPGDYQETYVRLTDDNQDVGVWAFILTLKGMPWDLSMWKLFWEEFKKHRDAKREDEVEIDRNCFVFKWDTKYLVRFETNLGRVQQSGWANFIKNEMKFSLARRGVGAR